MGALQDFYGPASPSLSAGLGLAADADGQAASARGQQGAAGAAAGGGGAELLSQADLVDYPYLIDGDPTPAAYLLLCCVDYLRIYSTGAGPGVQQQCCLGCGTMQNHGAGRGCLHGYHWWACSCASRLSAQRPSCLSACLMPRCT